MQPILTIIDKEWAEVFKNKMVLFTVAIMPLVFTIMPLGVLLAMNGVGATGSESTDMPAQFAELCLGSLSAGECLQAFMINEFMLLYMMMPLAIPVAIAAYSIVGEKTTRSLEPLLATPISTAQLLLGKGLSAVIPAIGATWVCYGIFLLLLPLVGASQAVRDYAASPTWLLAVLVIGPLMAVAATVVAVIVSSRVNDPRAAEQISMVVIVPLMGVLFGQIAGIIILNVNFMLITALVMVVVDLALVALGVRLFQRETILTRWK